MRIPFDVKVNDIRELPYTISYAIRKRSQIDNLNELPEAKRPPEYIIWSNNPEDLDDWLDKVMPKDGKTAPSDTFSIPLEHIE